MLARGEAIGEEPVVMKREARAMGARRFATMTHSPIEGGAGK